MTLAHNVADIVERTLTMMGQKDYAWVKLVKGTFAAETYLEELFDDDEDSVGFMMMHREWLRDVMRSDISPQKSVQEQIRLATGVDIMKLDLNQAFTALKYNIALQVAVTYCAYKANYLLTPNDNFEDLAGYYAKYWLNTPDDEAAKESFKKAYKAVFHDK